MKNLPMRLAAAMMVMSFGVAEAATLEVDKERSRIQVDAKATGHAFTGELKDYDVSAQGDAATNKASAFKLSWDFNDLKTGDEKRDAEMIKWLGGGKPKGVFQFDKAWDDGVEGGKAQGKLVINGVSHNVSFAYTVKRDGDFLTIDGRAGMDYQDFKLPIIRSMAIMTVDPKLVVRFHVVGRVK